MSGPPQRIYEEQCMSDDLRVDLRNDFMMNNV